MPPPKLPEGTPPTPNLAPSTYNPLDVPVLRPFYSWTNGLTLTIHLCLGDLRPRGGGGGGGGDCGGGGQGRGGRGPLLSRALRG